MTDKTLYVDEWNCPFGMITYVTDEEKLYYIEYEAAQKEKALYKKWTSKYFSNITWKQGSPIRNEITKQMNEYFNGERIDFSIPIELYGTDFQRSVWKALLSIPYGETVSYKQIAAQINSPKAIRAVGGAVNRNPLPIFVPCHRVVGHDGSLVGYNGGLDKKEFLLKLEKVL